MANLELPPDDEAPESTTMELPADPGDHADSRAVDELGPGIRTRLRDSRLVFALGILGSLASIAGLSIAIFGVPALVGNSQSSPATIVEPTTTTENATTSSTAPVATGQSSTVPEVEPDGPSSSETSDGASSTAAAQDVLGETAGIWAGSIASVDGESQRLTLLLDQSASAEPESVGQFGYGLCRGSLQLLSADQGQLLIARSSARSLNDCEPDGTFTFVRTGDSAAYAFSSNDNTVTSSGTLERTVEIDHRQPLDWPRDQNSASQGFMVWLGACLAGGSPPCSPTGGFPGWSTCSPDFCLAELGGVELFSRDDYRYLVTIPENASDPALELMFLGLTERQALELIAPQMVTGL